MNDTDINVVSYRILGSYRQGDSRFGATAGGQCACNSLLTVCID